MEKGKKQKILVSYTRKKTATMQCVLKVIKYAVFVACPFGLCGSGLLLGLPSVGFSGRATVLQRQMFRQPGGGGGCFSPGCQHAEKAHTAECGARGGIRGR